MTTRERAVSLLALFALAAGPAHGQGPPGAPGSDPRLHTWEAGLILPQKVSARLAWAERRLQPSGLRALERMALALAPSVASGDAAESLRRRAESEVAAAYPKLSLKDVSEAAFIVLAMATRDMDEDIRLIMAEIKAMASAKQKMRDMIKELNAWISQETSKRPGAGGVDVGGEAGAKTAVPSARPAAKAAAVAPRRLVLEARTSPKIRLEYVKAPAVPPLPPRNPGLPASELKALLGDVQGNLDGLNEMSEATSLRLQMTMDRRAKFISVLSQMMKKMSTTQQTLVQNIK